VPGLAGISFRRGRLIRPLLAHTRAELSAYAIRNRIAWREDPTNLDLRYARNAIRHVVLPALEAASPGATAALLRVWPGWGFGGRQSRGVIGDWADRLGVEIVKHKMGADPAHRFFATAMLYMVASCMDLSDRAEDEAWARRLLASRAGP
jgi:hypothetical protein